MNAMPSVITAGDSLSLLVATPHSAASGWVAKLRLVPRIAGGQVVTLTATPEGDSHRFTAAAVATANWASGEYSAVLWCELGAESITVESAQIRVMPDPRQIAAGTDTRTPAQKSLDDARAVLLAWDPRVRSYKIFDREREFNSVAEVRKLISQLEFEVAREAAGTNLTRPGGRIYFRRS